MRARVEVVERSGGRWGWRFVEGDYVLESNHDYASQTDAVRAASAAYSDPVVRIAPGDADRSRRIGLVKSALILFVIWRWIRNSRRR
jgi:hypothetical protein